MEVKQNVSLAEYTTLGVGGNARYFVTVHSVDELQEALSFAEEKHIPLLTLGGGSNVLISDDGFSGLVIFIELSGISFEDIDDNTVHVRAWAGEHWDQLVALCVEKGLHGIENLSGIPGLVGAAPVQNIGAYGVELKDTLISVDVFDTKEKKVCTMTREDCNFGYRDSIFKKESGAHLIVLNIVLRLDRNKTLHTAYRGIREYFEEMEIQDPILTDIREAVIAVRARKGMVIHPHYEIYQSAGSFFKNLIVERKVYKAVTVIDPNTPMYEVDEAHVKIPAAYLVEHAGFSRGHTDTSGRVSISPKHSLALINCGNATAKDFFVFAQEIQKKVFETFGVQLEPEVRFIGF